MPLAGSFSPVRTAVSRCQLLPGGHICFRASPCSGAASSFLVADASATAERQRRHCQQRLAQWRPQTSSSSATTASLPATSSRWLSTTAPVPASLSPRRLGQQQTSSGALANRSTTVHPASVSSKAPRPATNLIWRRRVLRFG